MRTKEEKEAMIAKLLELKKTVPDTTFFGENNHEAIDFQIDIIEKEWSEDDVYDEIDSRTGRKEILAAGEEFNEEHEEKHNEENGLIAAQWLAGTASDEDLLDW